jgi:hypothetical protein
MKKVQSTFANRLDSRPLIVRRSTRFLQYWDIRSGNCEAKFCYGTVPRTDSSDVSPEWRPLWS